MGGNGVSNYDPKPLQQGPTQTSVRIFYFFGFVLFC